MDENHLLHKPDANGLICPILWHVQDDTELVAQKLEAPIASWKIVHLEASQKQFHPVGQEGILEVLHHDALENLLVRRRDESPQNEHDRNDIFLLAPTEAEHRATVGKVMQCVCGTRLIRTHAAHLYSIGRV